MNKAVFGYATLLSITVLVMFGTIMAYGESLLPEYTLKDNYVEPWGKEPFLSSTTMTLENGDTLTCKSSYWMYSKCDIIMIKQNERIIDLLEQLVEK